VINVKRDYLLRAIVALAIAALDTAALAQNGFDLSNSLIPPNEIVPGGPPRDGIPAIDHPQFVKPSEVDFLRDEDCVLSVKIDNETRAYPLPILAWHEIVNDQIGNYAIAVTYCPLAGTGIVFDRQVKGRKLSFGVSGLLYQSDLVMYDRQTESLWPQIGMKAVSGAQAGAELRRIPSEHITWRAWREANPDGKVLSTKTGYGRDYGDHAYVAYEHSGETMFPVRWSRPELSKKSWVIGVIVNGQAKAYALDDLKKKRVQDNVGDQQIEVAYDSVRGSADVINKQDGQPIPFTMAYWFAWQAFYPKTELFRH
jgi:Protein of unknown function (DUF3179)